MAGGTTTNNQNVTNSNPLLAQLEKFGFKFYGFDENNQILVVGPNGQVTPLNLAYQFIQKQIQSVGSGMTVEQMPQSPDIGTSFEAKTEVGIERSVEDRTERQDQVQRVQPKPSPAQGSQKQPIISTGRSEFKPYGEGYEPPFQSADVVRVLNFISSNSAANNTSSNKWIAVLWEKFLKERDLQAKK